MSDIVDRIVSVGMSRCKVTEDDLWVPRKLGLSYAVEPDEFRSILPTPPRGSKWDLDRQFRVKVVPGGYKTEGVSCCALVGIRILHDAGLNLSAWVDEKYREWKDPTGKGRDYSKIDAVTALSLLAHRTGCARPTGAYPQRSDLICIGSGLSTHIATVLSVDGHTIWSADGGSVDVEHTKWINGAPHALQAIRLTKRNCRGIRIVWVMDTEKLHKMLSM